MKKQNRFVRLAGAFVLLVGACVAAATGGCRKEQGHEAGSATLPAIAGKKIVMIIARSNFRDEELFEPKKIIERAGGKVTVASSTLKEAKGMLGKTFKPDVLLKDVRADDYDAVAFIGGSGAKEYWNDATAHSLASFAAKKGKPVCAICIAPVTLANAGLLDGKRATVWKSEAKTIEAKGAKYAGTDVEVDGNIITADGPTSAAKFGEAIVRALAR